MGYSRFNPGIGIGERPGMFGCPVMASFSRRTRRRGPHLVPSGPSVAREASALDRVVLEQAPADDHALDVGCAFTDQQHRRLPVEPLDLVLLGVAVAAVDPEG